jgi:hypothetical protein
VSKMVVLDSDLTRNLCGSCSSVSVEVIHAEKNVRRGWYCSQCKKFTPAIGRERLVMK